MSTIRANWLLDSNVKKRASIDEPNSSLAGMSTCQSALQELHAFHFLSGGVWFLIGMKGDA
jgi:hypothetical protein